MNPRATTITAEGINNAFPWNNAQRFPLPDDEDARVILTVAAMAAFIHAGAISRGVAELAQQCKLPDGTLGANARGIWYLLKDTQRKVEDPAGVELLRHPEQLAASIAARGTFEGDCDDVAMLAASLGIRLGFGVSIRVVARAGHGWEHVYTVLHGPSSSYVIDPQETSAPFAERERARQADFLVWSRG